MTTLILQGGAQPPRSKPAPLPPVRLREDFFDWVNEDDLQLEVWAAFRGAVRYYREYDFDADVRGLGTGDSLIPGTMICKAEGDPWGGRYSFLELLVSGLAWRLEALANRRGVDTQCYDRQIGYASLYPTAADALAESTEFGKYFGGEVTQHHFKTKREAMAYMKAQREAQKSAPAAATNSSRAVTNVDRSNDDGTNCRP